MVGHSNFFPISTLRSFPFQKRTLRSFRAFYSGHFFEKDIKNALMYILIQCHFRWVQMESFLLLTTLPPPLLVSTKSQVFFIYCLVICEKYMIIVRRGTVYKVFHSFMLRFTTLMKAWAQALYMYPLFLRQFEFFPVPLFLIRYHLSFWLQGGKLSCIFPSLSLLFPS